MGGNGRCGTGIAGSVEWFLGRSEPGPGAGMTPAGRDAARAPDLSLTFWGAHPEPRTDACSDPDKYSVGRGDKGSVYSSAMVINVSAVTLPVVCSFFRSMSSAVSSGR